jgi:ParB/RepB/Spo0J family partition protein
MMTDTPESVTLVPIDRIEVLNSRDRNMKVFEEIVENIRVIGLKKPITVTEREGADGAPAFLLVCGEGRLNAFRLLGETHIPALVVNVTDEDAFIMSLAENIARRGHRPLEILADIELLLARDYSIDDIIQRTGLSEKYVRDIVFLLEKGEERLIEAVQTGSIPLTTALEIARAKHDDETPPSRVRPVSRHEHLNTEQRPPQRAAFRASVRHFQALCYNVCMSTPAVSLATLQALEAALFRGVRTVAYDGGTISYASTAEMLQLRAMLRTELGLPPAASSRRPRPRRAVVSL